MSKPKKRRLTPNAEKSTSRFSEKPDGLSSAESGAGNGESSSGLPENQVNGGVGNYLGDLVFSRYAIIAVILSVSVWGFWVSKNTPPKVDEPYHYWQITMFMEGDWSMLKEDERLEYPFFAMLPGYHAVTAVIFSILQITDPVWIRVFSIACGLGTFCIALLVSLRVEGKANHLRAAQVFFSPFAFPFYFLLYSDIFSLLTVLALVYTSIFRQKLATVFTSISCLLVRQSQIVILALLAALEIKLVFVHCEGTLKQRVVASARSTLRLIPAFSFFAMFFVWNGWRVPMCYPHLQQTSTLGWNMLIFCALASIWLAPVQLAMARECVNFVGRNRLLSLAIVLAVIALISRLWIEDPRNRISHFVDLLRNYVMDFAIGSVYGYVLFATTAIWAIISILATKWTHQCGYLTLGVVVLTMGPIMLVEPRYFIPAASWYLLFRSHQSVAVERVQLVWMFILACGLHWFQSATIYLM
jgi:alpha-1,2-glucosyltransferase